MFRWNEKKRFTQKEMDKKKDNRKINNFLNTEYKGYHYTLARDSNKLRVKVDKQIATF